MAKRGRRPKSVHLKIIQGNAGKRPLNEHEPEIIEPLGGPPANWQEDAKELWCEVVEYAPDGVLTMADRFLVEITARLLAQIRAAPDANAAVVTQLRQCLGEMGMTPSARTRLSIAPTRETNPFADL